MTTHRIDAANRKLGRLASEISVILMGKHMPDFARNKPGTDHVLVMNADKLSLPMKKRKETTYVRYSGYPRGIRLRTMEKMIEKFDVKSVIEAAVYRMLPGNRLRPNRMKRLIIKESE
ncbi:MAG: large subunit ribosomal protein L13 [Parcubacteria group bacterium Gr01-1014_48]|nr:MAG: large subunit ribosomal protein L13 [Parcubacteria group bacterium Greene0416_14]TSC72233.1 MAG: large subunit ribosomal protein L13 [Parcubacteria group bacterium Gr01-1014_48]TSD01670.1 MAG: large subunit ribosomal protein L13 [Parcubacteria group bacterium Greene1014_15]TSD07814.1 MAG: large subunit ribosomal protein L13 [Parcubacteria group bacterium Greene0714_4]